jgi:hypothetical protein
VVTLLGRQQLQVESFRLAQEKLEFRFCCSRRELRCSSKNLLYQALIVWCCQLWCCVGKYITIVVLNAFHIMYNATFLSSHSLDSIYVEQKVFWKVFSKVFWKYFAIFWKKVFLKYFEILFCSSILPSIWNTFSKYFAHPWN